MACGWCAAGRPRTMNVYLIADDGGVTMFDAGISDMSGALRSICARFGGLRQIVLGHADCDHRGAAPAQGVPVLCHPDERAAAESDVAFRPYWDLNQLAPYARPVYRRLLQHWDGGPGRGRADAHRRRRDRGLPSRRAAGPRARADRPVPRGGPPGARLRLLLHGRPADRPQERRARAPPRVQPRHRAGASIDPQARRARPARGLGRPRRAGPRSGRRRAACSARRRRPTY